MADGTGGDAEPVLTRETRELACQLAVQVCEGHLPTGSTLLAYIILFETYLDQGANETANVMGWDVVERAPVSLADVRARLREVIDNG